MVRNLEGVKRQMSGVRSEEPRVRIRASEVRVIMIMFETLSYDSLVDALGDLVRGLVVYEQRYQMGPAACFAQNQAGTLGDAAHIVEWAGNDQLSVGLRQELSALESRWMTPLQSYLLDIR
jgi:hypothetical protein